MEAGSTTWGAAFGVGMDGGRTGVGARKGDTAPDGAIGVAARRGGDTGGGDTGVGAFRGSVPGSAPTGGGWRWASQRDGPGAGAVSAGNCGVPHGVARTGAPDAGSAAARGRTGAGAVSVLARTGRTPAGVDPANAGAPAPTGAACRRGDASAENSPLASSAHCTAAPTAISPPHTEQRARIETLVILAGSTRKTDRHSGQEMFIGSAWPGLGRRGQRQGQPA